MIRRIFIISIVVTLVIQTGCAQNNSQDLSNKKEKEIVVFAAASLTEALTQISSMFEKEYGIKVDLNLASSGTLEKQILEGAYCDLFISANAEKMDMLEKEKLVIENSRRNFLNNRLVLIAPNNLKGKITSLDDLKMNKTTQIGMGTVETVPAGKYAYEAFGNLNLWNEIKGKIVYAKDVKQVVYYVESGNVEAGVVYESDAVHLKNSFVVMKFPEKSHSKIVYPLGIIKDSKSIDETQKFLEYFNRDDIKNIFKAQGFSIR